MNIGMMTLWTVCWAVGCALCIVPWWMYGMKTYPVRLSNKNTFSFLRHEKIWWLRKWEPLQKLEEAMSVLGMKQPLETVLLWSGALFLLSGIGIDAGLLAWERRYVSLEQSQTALSPLVLSMTMAALGGSIPFFYIMFRVQRMRHRIAQDMMKLVQNVIGHYQVDRTILELIARCSEAMPSYVYAEWKRLEMRAMLHGSLEQALYEFAVRTQNVWAEDLADILILKHKYGNDVIAALHKLMLDMQVARKQEETRIAMITVYRIGTVILVLFAIFTVVFNIAIDENHYRYYMMYPLGKTIIMGSIFVMFISLVLVVRAGKRAF